MDFHACSSLWNCETKIRMKSSCCPWGYSKICIYALLRPYSVLLLVALTVPIAVFHYLPPTLLLTAALCGLLLTIPGLLCSKSLSARLAYSSFHINSV